VHLDGIQFSNQLTLVSGAQGTIRSIHCLLATAQRLDQHTARTFTSQTLRCGHRCRLAASAQFSQILIADFEKSAANRFFEVRAGDASDASPGESEL
jgi:hypothetical protein